jgi:hypothetical protein
LSTGRRDVRLIEIAAKGTRTHQDEVGSAWAGVATREEMAVGREVAVALAVG